MEAFGCLRGPECESCERARAATLAEALRVRLKYEDGEPTEDTPDPS